MPQGHPLEYSTAIRIRDASISVGNEIKRNFLLREQASKNYAVLDNTQRLHLMGNEKGEINGILIEWEEVRIGGRCLKTLLKIQALTNVAQSTAEGKLICRPKCPHRRKSEQPGSVRPNEIWKIDLGRRNIPMYEEGMCRPRCRTRKPNMELSD